MDPRSRRRFSSLPAPPRQGACYGRHGSPGADRISSLSDDMILLVLARLHCIRTAVRTGLLSRRWRGLWTRLTDLPFHGVPAATVEAALPYFSTASPAGTMFKLDICLPSELDAAQANSPSELVFTLPPPPHPDNVVRSPIQLPCFHRATSIDMDTQRFIISPPPAGCFAMLERLSMSGRIVSIGALVTRCPRLRVLSAKFRGLGPESIVPALSSLKSALHSREITVSLLDICILSRDVDSYGLQNIGTPVFVLLLGITAGLSPEKLVFTNKYDTQTLVSPVNMPCFPRSRSIEIDWRGITFTWPWYGGFSVLERLCLVGCNVGNLGALVSSCPSLRVLRVGGATSKQDITVHSATLRELVLGTYTECRGIDVVTPILKRLAMEVHAAGDLSMFVSAPLVEKVSWRRSYTGPYFVFGSWVLWSMSLETTESYRERVPAKDGEDTCLQVQHMPHGHVLSLYMCAYGPSNAHHNFAGEVDKLPVTDISVVDIRLQSIGHAYGATLLRLLETPRVQSAIRIIKLTLLRPGKFKVTEACTKKCSCNQPKSWGSQSIALKHLQVVEIKGFKGDDHDFNFVELILPCAQMLKRMTLKLENGVNSYGYRGCTEKIHNISMMYPSVNFRVYLGSRRQLLS